MLCSLFLHTRDEAPTWNTSPHVITMTLAIGVVNVGSRYFNRTHSKNTSP